MQHTNKDTYEVILAARIFRALMIIVATFDLKARQFDAINAFVNCSIDESTFSSFSEGYSSHDKKSNVLQLQRAIYELKQSSVL
jgi:hypothetical protein